MKKLISTSIATFVLVFLVEPIFSASVVSYGSEECFIKLSKDQKKLYLQNTYMDSGPNDVNILLIDTGQLNGHAISKLDDASLLYDQENSVYKMWLLASTGKNGYWSVYYADSNSLLNWNAENIQECYYGVSDSWDISRQDSISVLKESNTSYKMWFSNYQASGWKTQIWYRSSTDGVTWMTPQLVISAVTLDDWIRPTGLHLTSGNYRLYYEYCYRDVYDFSYQYRADVGQDGVTTSNITQFAKIPYRNPSFLGAAIIGNQNGDSHHRVWLSSKGNLLLRYDSFDEGQNWTETSIGIYDTNNYWIVGTFYTDIANELNHQPVADAGPNQIAYAFLDGLADVNLDGSASYDDDNDILDYYWFWTIDSNLCEANGVSPTIKLPVGQHQIELVVDDGWTLSEPNRCTIEVIEPIKTWLWLQPRIFSCNSRPRRIMTIMFLLEDTEPNDVNNQPMTMYPCDIQSNYQRVFKMGYGQHARTVVLAVFDKGEICDALGIGRHQVEVAGQLQSGRYFYGTNIIRITRPNSHKWPFRRFCPWQ